MSCQVRDIMDSFYLETCTKTRHHHYHWKIYCDMFPNLGWLGVAEDALTTRLWRPHKSPLMLFYDFMHVWTCEINFRKWLRLCFCLVRTRLDTRAFTSSSEGSAAKQMLLRTGSMTQLLSTRKTRLFQRKIYFSANISVFWLSNLCSHDK